MTVTLRKRQKMSPDVFNKKPVRIRKGFTIFTRKDLC